MRKYVVAGPHVVSDPDGREVIGTVRHTLTGWQARTRQGHQVAGFTTRGLAVFWLVRQAHSAAYEKELAAR